MKKTETKTFYVGKPIDAVYMLVKPDGSSVVYSPPQKSSALAWLAAKQFHGEVMVRCFRRMGYRALRVVISLEAKP